MEETDNNIVLDHYIKGTFYVPNQVVKYNLEITWLNIGNTNDRLIICVNDKIKWYTLLFLKLLGCKLTKVDENNKKEIIPVKTRVYNKLNSILKKLLNIE